MSSAPFRVHPSRGRGGATLEDIPMQTTDLHDIAAALRTARADGKPIPAPTTTWPALDADAAFDVQRITAGRGRRRW